MASDSRPRQRTQGRISLVSELQLGRNPVVGGAKAVGVLFRNSGVTSLGNSGSYLNPTWGGEAQDHNLDSSQPKALNSRPPSRKGPKQRRTQSPQGPEMLGFWAPHKAPRSSHTT